MNDEQFKELMELNQILTSKKYNLLEFKHNLATKQREQSKILSKLQESLNIKMSRLLNDTEKRAEYGCKNQNCWSAVIKKEGFLEKHEIAIESFKTDSQKVIDAWTNQIEELKIEISDLSKEISIKLEYYRKDTYQIIVDPAMAKEMVKVGN